MSTSTVTRPAPPIIAPASAWSVSGTGQGRGIFTTSSQAAVWITDEAMLQMRYGHTPAVTVQLIDPDHVLLWDASSDVADVLAATGWPTLDGDILHLRVTVIRILTAILVSDETPTDFATPLATPRPVPRALICR